MPRFGPGDSVRVLDLGKTGHVRVPHYVRGARGAVERYCGAFANPEELAYGRPGLPPVDLYRVRIDRAAIFPDAPPGDDIEIEVHDHWLAPAKD